MKKILPQSFQYPVINDEQRKYGASFLQNPEICDGDWRKSLTPEEEQRRFGVEPSSCFVEAQQHTIATIEEKEYQEIDNNYSARFNALLAGGTDSGGDPLKAADSIKNDGLVKESSMPHDESIKSWEEFHSWQGVDEAKVRAEGQADKAKKKRRFGVLFERHYPLELKYDLIKKGLRRSPIPMSVWAVTDENGNYVEKPEGVIDTHMVQATYLDEVRSIIHVRDTYPPFDKELPAMYNPDFGMGWTVEKIDAAPMNIVIKPSLWQRFLNWLFK